MFWVRRWAPQARSLRKCWCYYPTTVACTYAQAVCSQKTIEGNSKTFEGDYKTFEGNDCCRASLNNVFRFCERRTYCSSTAGEDPSGQGRQRLRNESVLPDIFRRKKGWRRTRTANRSAVLLIQYDRSRPHRLCARGDFFVGMYGEFLCVYFYFMAFQFVKKRVFSWDSSPKG